MDNAYNFGEILLHLREKKGLTQDKLAQRLGLKNSTISKYETSISPPPALMVRKIAKEFGVSSDLLLGIEAAESVSLRGLSEEQSQIVKDLADLFRTQNSGLKRRMTTEQFYMLGRITVDFTKK